MRQSDHKAAIRHQIIVCTSCRHWSRTTPAGPLLIDNLRNALVVEGLDLVFDVSGSDCMAGCDHPCTVAWRADGKATWLFGDIEPEADVGDLVRFAWLYQGLEDGWCRAADRPGKLARTALARIPAVLTQTGPRGVEQ